MSAKAERSSGGPSGPKRRSSGDRPFLPPLLATSPPASTRPASQARTLRAAQGRRGEGEMGKRRRTTRSPDADPARWRSSRVSRSAPTRLLRQRCGGGLATMSGSRADVRAGAHDPRRPDPATAAACGPPASRRACWRPTGSASCTGSGSSRARRRRAGEAEPRGRVAAHDVRPSAAHGSRRPNVPGQSVSGRCPAPKPSPLVSAPSTQARRRIVMRRAVPVY